MSFDAQYRAAHLLLPAQEKIVLMHLAFRLNQKTERCDPSLRDVVKFTGLSKSSVCRALQALESRKLIQRTKTFVSPFYSVTAYSLLLPTPDSNGDIEVPQGDPCVPNRDCSSPTQTLQVSPTDTLTRNKNKEVEHGSKTIAPDRQASAEELQGTGLSAESFSSYMLVRKKKRKSFVDEATRERWLARFRNFYADGKDTADMLHQMIDGQWQGPVEEKWKQRPVTFVNESDEDSEAWLRGMVQ